MGATRLDTRKYSCPYGCMRIASESQQNRPVFEAGGEWRWKMGHLRQREVQTVVVEKRWGCPEMLRRNAASPLPRNVNVAKPGLTARKVLLCVWWDWQGIIHYELLPYGQTRNSDLYCQQLDRLNAALMQKRPSLLNRGRIVFHQDNSRPHRSLVTIGKRASIRGALWSWHLVDLNRIIVTNFMNNWKFNKNTARLFCQPITIFFKINLCFFLQMFIFTEIWTKINFFTMISKNRRFARNFDIFSDIDT